MPHVKKSSIKKEKGNKVPILFKNLKKKKFEIGNGTSFDSLVV